MIKIGLSSPAQGIENFRNTRKIFDFAKLYGPDVDTARDNGKKPAMIKCSDYGHYAIADFMMLLRCSKEATREVNDYAKVVGKMTL